MSPLSEVGGHHDFGFQTVREDGSRFLRRATKVEQVEVGSLGILAGAFPNVIARCALVEKGRLNNGDFALKIVLRVIAVPSRLLTVRSESVTDNFVRNAPVAYELY